MTNKAIVLIGPTGSGKTPLGECLQRKGLGGQRCFHFDFGTHLRRAAESDGPHGLLTRDDLETITSVLETGALLEDGQFHIAAKILQDFLRRQHVGRDDYVVLNGMPRHVGQARRIESIVIVERVVQLTCTPEVVLQRIRTNSGSDRSGRTDDDIESVSRRLAIFQQRTAPLVEHYRSRGVPIETVHVTPTSTAETLYRQLVGKPDHRAC